MFLFSWSTVRSHFNFANARPSAYISFVYVPEMYLSSDPLLTPSDVARSTLQASLPGAPPRKLSARTPDLPVPGSPRTTMTDSTADRISALDTFQVSRDSPFTGSVSSPYLFAKSRIDASLQSRSANVRNRAVLIAARHQSWISPTNM